MDTLSLTSRVGFPTFPRHPPNHHGTRESAIAYQEGGGTAS